LIGKLWAFAIDRVERLLIKLLLFPAWRKKFILCRMAKDEKGNFSRVQDWRKLKRMPGDDRQKLSEA